MPLITSRRAALTAASATLALTALPGSRARAAAGAASSTDISGQLAKYIVSANNTPLPADVVTAAKQHILDTFAAMVSGSRMRPGMAAVRYIESQGGTPQASVIGTSFRTTIVNAGFANAMCAHSDESDDFEGVTKAHPGSSAVPAAFAMAEARHSSGTSLIRAVTLGYDLGCRLLMALGPDLVRGTHRSAEGTASTFCALGAATLAGLDVTATRYAISYASQEVSGLWSWVKDKDHIEKAFDFAGMGTRNGLAAITFVQSGMTGVYDVLDGTNNLFIALSTKPQPEQMIAGLGSHFFIMDTAIKSYGVGYPNQSALDAFLTLRQQYKLTPQNVRSIVVKLPTDAIGIVGDSAMPDVDCRHIIAVALIKGAVSFPDADDASLMHDPAMMQERQKVTVTGDPSLMDPSAPRGATVEVTMADGKTVSHHTKFPPGTPQNPLSTQQVSDKAYGLMAPVLGDQKAKDLIEKLNNLDSVKNVAALRPLFAI